MISFIHLFRQNRWTFEIKRNNVVFRILKIANIVKKIIWAPGIRLSETNWNFDISIFKVHFNISSAPNVTNHFPGQMQICMIDSFGRKMNYSGCFFKTFVTGISRAKSPIFVLAIQIIVFCVRHEAIWLGMRSQLDYTSWKWG